MNELPIAMCFPRDDARFAEHVRFVFESSQVEQVFAAAAEVERAFAAAVQALLRETYPRAVVAPRSQLGAIDGRRVWYAFRDGGVVAGVEAQTR